VVRDVIGDVIEVYNMPIKLYEQFEDFCGEMNELSTSFNEFRKLPFKISSLPFISGVL